MRFKINSKFEASLIYYYFLAGIILLIAVFLFLLPISTSAQTEETAPPPAAEPAPAPPPPAEPPAPEPSPEPVPAAQAEPSEQISAEAELDSQVTAQDLRVETGNILPDNPLYGLKRLGRSLKETFTFNPVKKAALRLKNANKELAETQELLKQKPADQEAMEATAKAVGKFEEKLEKIKDQTEKLKQEKAKGETRVDFLLDNVLDQQIKQQKVLESIEEHILEQAPTAVAEQALDKIEQAKEGSAAHVGEVISRVEEDQEQLVQRFDRVLEKQAGSEFKELKNLQVLKRIEEKVPEAARQAIERAQENAFKRFHDNLQQLPDEEREEKFERYMHNVRGDEMRHMEVLDHLKQYEDLPPEILQKMEAAKDIMARRLENRFEDFEQRFNPEFRQRAMERAFRPVFEGGPNIDKLRVMEEVRQRVKFDDQELQQEMDKHHQASIEKFKQAFPDAEAEAEKFRELSAQMAENPDPLTFRLIQELEEEVKADPKKREFIEKMEQEAKQQFAAKIKEKGDKFFEQIASNNPEDIEIFKKLKQDFSQNPEEFFGPPPFAEPGMMPPGMGPESFGPPPFMGEQFAPPGFDKFFDQAIRSQSEYLQEHLQEIDDPEMFEHFQKKLHFAPPEILQEIKMQQPQFADIFQDKRHFIEEMELEKQADQWRWQQEEERMRAEEEFNRRREQAQTPEDWERLDREEREFNRQFMETSRGFEGEMLEKRLQFDPFCDEECRRWERERHQQMVEQEKQVFEQELQLGEIEKELWRFEEKQRKAQEMMKYQEFGPEGMAPEPHFGPEPQSMPMPPDQEFEKPHYEPQPMDFKEEFYYQPPPKKEADYREPGWSELEPVTEPVITDLPKDEPMQATEPEPVYDYKEPEPESIIYNEPEPTYDYKEPQPAPIPEPIIAPKKFPS